MKTYKQRTEDIIQKAQKQKALNKKITVSAISATACAAVVALNLVLFMPLKAPETPIDAYKNSEYFSVIKPLNAHFNKTKQPVHYKNNFEKWSAGLKEFFSADLKGGANGVTDDMMGGNSDIEPPTITTPDEDFWWEEDAETGEGDSAQMPEGGTDGDGYVETTDNQVANVIEGDLFKRTNSHIFYLSPKYDGYELSSKGAREDDDFVLRAYSIEGENSRLVGECRVLAQSGYSWANQPEMYLSADGKTVTIITTAHQYSKSGTQVLTEIITVNVTSPAQMKEVSRTYLSGQYVSSRSVEGKLIIVNNFNVNTMPDFDDYASYIPQYGDDLENMQLVSGEDIIVPEQITARKHTVVMELDQTTGEIEDCMALYCYSADLYVSKDNMYLTREYQSNEDWERMTEITCISYEDEGFAQVGSVTVEGSVLNQYSMDEYCYTQGEYEGKQIFRVVTTVYTPYTSASLYCVDTDTWEIIGADEEFSPEDEDVQSVRFDGEKAYVCTAEVIALKDPVFIFDLSNPTKPESKDTGVIEGYSSSLVQLKDGYLLGIGFDNRRSLKISVYEEGETDVEEVAAYNPGEFLSFSAEYKAYFIDRTNNFIGLATYGLQNGSYGQQYRLLCFDGYEIVEVAVVPLEIRSVLNYTRATMIDGYLYIFGAEFKVVKIYE